MGFYIYSLNRRAGGDCLLTGRVKCGVVVEMLQSFTVAETERRKKKERDEIAAAQAAGDLYYGWGQKDITNPDEVPAQVLVAAHLVLPYTLEKYIEWIHNQGIHTLLVLAMKETPDEVQLVFDRARDLIRSQALAKDGIYLSW